MPTAQPPEEMDADDLTGVDEDILDELRDGRATKGALVDWTGRSRNSVYNRLSVLEAAGFVEAVHSGTRLFQLVEDPRREWVKSLSEPAQEFVRDVDLDNQQQGKASAFEEGVDVLHDSLEGGELTKAQGAYSAWFRSEYEKDQSPGFDDAKRVATELVEAFEGDTS